MSHDRHEPCDREEYLGSEVGCRRASGRTGSNVAAGTAPPVARVRELGESFKRQEGATDLDCARFTPERTDRRRINSLLFPTKHRHHRPSPSPP